MKIFGQIGIQSESIYHDWHWVQSMGYYSFMSKILTIYNTKCKRGDWFDTYCQIADNANWV